MRISDWSSDVCSSDLLNTSLEHEVCGMILVDTQHRLIAYLEPFRGTLDQASVYPREIVKLTLPHNAKAIFLVHNHPSGEAQASEADIRLTKHLKPALAPIDVQLLVHFIVVGSQVLTVAVTGIVDAGRRLEVRA